LIDGGVIANKDMIKVLFDTSPYCNDIELIKEMIWVVDKSSRVSIQLMPHKIYLLLRAVSPFAVTQSDIDFDFSTWNRSFFRVFWMKRVEQLITNKHKGQ
jgi:hypothetical protein